MNLSAKHVLVAGAAGVVVLYVIGWRSLKPYNGAADAIDQANDDLENAGSEARIPGWSRVSPLNTVKLGWTIVVDKIKNATKGS